MLIPDTIDIEQSEKYTLSVRISASEFIFSLSQANDSKKFCLRAIALSPEKSLSENIKQIVFENEFLIREFRKTNVVVVSEEYSIIPSAFYKSNEKISLYNLINEEEQQILVCDNDQFDIVTLFGIESDIYEFLSRSLYNPHFYHHTSLLINYLGNRSGESKKIKNIYSKMYLNFRKNALDIICFSNSEFASCTSYIDDALENQIYYIVHLWKKSGFDQFRDQLFIIGNPGELLPKTLGEYIKHINTVTLPSEVYLWNEEALQTPLDLLSLSL